MIDFRFDGQVAIVTGAGRGIGQAYAIELARRGASVLVNDLGGVGTPDGPWAETVVQLLLERGGKAVASMDSVSTVEGGIAITQMALDHFGTIDILINNAGFLRRGMFADLSMDDARDVIDVHLMGAFHVTQPAWKVMLKKKYGRVLMTSSAASFGMQANCNYVAAKAGLIGLASALAQEGEAHGVFVNSILPYVKTMITKDSPAVGPDAVQNVSMQDELAHRMTPGSVAAAALYLVSRQSKVNGKAISALAGRYAAACFAMNEGVLIPHVEDIEVETIANAIDRIVDLDRIAAVESLGAELEQICARVDALGTCSKAGG
jgi:NAD(P)-dependent dehydrogenase (short-subunit alcohol dehydrogenase family)